MARNNSKTTDEVQIRQLIDCWAGAARGSARLYDAMTA
jgi:hypothetical protein